MRTDGVASVTRVKVTTFGTKTVNTQYERFMSDEIVENTTTLYDIVHKDNTQESYTDLGDVSVFACFTTCSLFYR